MFLVACESDIPQDVQMESIQTNEAIEPGKVLIVTGEYLPYTSSDKNNPGFLDATVIEVLNRSGIDYEVRYYPWERCREMLRNGEAWASYPYGFSEDNLNDFNFSVPIFSSQHLYYYRENQDIFKDSSKIFEDLQDFKGLTFGGTNGYWYGSPSDIKAMGINVEWADDTEALVKMLYARRIDFFIEDKYVAEHIIQRLYKDDQKVFQTLNVSARNHDYYMILSKTYPDTDQLKKSFNEAYKSIFYDGTYQRIMADHNIF
ncbi:conserved protein of unknown function [Petrocella atlantisensis]|uniref:Solute-binding protein family 3/N-terminal domain-containing protein n=1 Tax=Petrocella atlantisensis TaxID=2173034 RepID=A0A3P7RTY8_9FIRM|nr:transporter substrate-binding domain-containing protein [Petrocella atlantisensis]MCF8018453.1 transporter substrate-binding domain-containing protein [Vallitaleaceae bacterium]VDN46336.1 conserved protein of unknown function [Petrocella atlantisensis]